MAKLNQIIAIEKGIKGLTHSGLSELYKAVQKPELFNGFSKDYLPKDEDGEKLPSERKRVQFTTPDALRASERAMTGLMQVTARKDWTNCSARGTVTVNGQSLIADVPVSYLLFLEKQLTDLHTFVKTIPVLDVADDWKRDDSSGLFKTEPVQTHRTKKEQRPLVLYPHSAEHPAQTAMITEDVIAGYWSMVKQSGAMRKPEKDLLLERIETLQRAIKQAREAANMTEEVPVPDVGAAIFQYLLPK